MKRRGLLILMIILMLLTISGFALYSWFFSLESYNTIERSKIAETRDYLQEGLIEQEEQLLSQLRDYSIWDDSYQHATGTYPSYPEDNFNELSLENLNIQSIAIIDRNNSVLFQTTYDPLVRQLKESEIAPGIFSRLIVDSETESRTILISENNTPILYVSSPILHTDNSGPVAGTYIFGRRIDQTFSEALERSVHHPVEVTAIPAGLEGRSTTIPGYPALLSLITAENNDQIEESFLTLSSDGENVIIFRIIRPKDVAIMGRQIFAQSLLALILLATACIVIMTLIFFFGFRRYEKAQKELEETQREIRISTERKKISDTIQRILDVLLTFGPDSRENIRSLVSLTRSLVNADAVLYSVIHAGEEILIASTSLPPDYSAHPGPAGNLSSTLTRDGADTFYFSDLQRTVFADTDPLIKTGRYQVCHGCRVLRGQKESGILATYYRDDHSPGELDEVILHLISNLISVEANRYETENALHRRDVILEAVSTAATILMQEVVSPDFNLIFGMFGEILEISRVYIRLVDENHEDHDHETWVSPGISDQATPAIPFLTDSSTWQEQISGWITLLREGEVVAGPVGSFHGTEQEYVRSLGIKSLALFPVFRSTHLFAVLILEDHVRLREWIPPECEALKAAAALIGSTLERMENERIQKRYMEQLIGNSEELSRINLALNERTALIETLLTRKNELITQIGHDIRTPLTPILGLIPLLQKGEDDPEKITILEHIRLGASRIKILLDKILYISDLQTDKSDDIAGHRDLATLVTAVVNQYADQMAEKEISHMITIPHGLYTRIVDRRLFLTVEEITRNAIRFTEPGGEIRYSGWQEEDRVWLKISDTGTGMTEQEIDRIFDLFYKSDLSRHSLDTHGLGLSIVKQLLEREGGNITAESDGPGSGSRFTISLPARSGLLPAERSKNQRDQSDIAGNDFFHNQR